MRFCSQRVRRSLQSAHIEALIAAASGPTSRDEMVPVGGVPSTRVIYRVDRE